MALFTTHFKHKIKIKIKIAINLQPHMHKSKPNLAQVVIPTCSLVLGCPRYEARINLVKVICARHVHAQYYLKSLPSWYSYKVGANVASNHISLVESLIQMLYQSWVISSLLWRTFDSTSSKKHLKKFLFLVLIPVQFFKNK